MDASVKERYKSLFGYVPEKIQHRYQLAEMASHPESLEAIENYRKVLIEENPLEAKYQQLVHFALLIGAREIYPAQLHAVGALKAGATVKELYGVCETAAITGGMPAFTLAIECVTKAIKTINNNP
ncbi:carboxymuconolactone decarboxylase family protein [uncultured Aquimarina sp.]|uniref:carboxymuconolactone decarboxylase family protein n=1 Tax=uncultured Aquimarina sp. TaxID=575652 RepID=UPI002606DB71|nr:carboxymuconolactone decarboxylase family protein [uncultured Aquimarina sp.]